MVMRTTIMTIQNQSLGKKRYNLNRLSEKLIECITEIFEYFELPYTTNTDRMISFPCPIHDGDNESGSSILKEGIGNWQCYTNQCHETHGTTIIQFMSALLSKTYEKEFSFYETLKWCANYVGEDPEYNVEEDSTKTRFIQLCKYLNHKKKIVPTFTSRDLVKKIIEIPSDYYINRGYSKEILEKFDIGYCKDQKRSFYNRILVPFYDDNGEYMVGYSSRSAFEKCAKCKMYHNPNTRCPITKEEKLKNVKWKHSSNFNRENYLYNYWNAKDWILNSRIAVLVEGTGDVWRLEQAGIPMGLAILGSQLSSGQRYILESSGATNIIVAMDNDESGRKAFKQIEGQCLRFFNVYQFQYDSKDIGEMEPNKLKSLMLEIIQKIIL